MIIGLSNIVLRRLRKVQKLQVLLETQSQLLFVHGTKEGGLFGLVDQAYDEIEHSEDTRYNQIKEEIQWLDGGGRIRGTAVRKT